MVRMGVLSFPVEVVVILALGLVAVVASPPGQMASRLFFHLAS